MQSSSEKRSNFLKNTSPTRRPWLRAGAEWYQQQLTAEEQCDLESLFTEAVTDYLCDQRPVYLDGFGFCIPTLQAETATQIFADNLYLREETIRSLEFEKCAELTAFHRTKFPKLVEPKELCAKVYTKLPFPFSRSWAPRELSRLLSALIDQVRMEVIGAGFSTRLINLGTFYALHNRQGSTPRDWFAGADIFLCRSFRQTTRASAWRAVSAPVLQDAWELLEAAYGPAVAKLNLNLRKELTELGYDQRELKPDLSVVPVAVFFERSATDSSCGTLVYCTNGLRQTGIKNSREKTGIEFVFQLPISEESGKVPRAKEVPLWPLRPLTLGWILIQGRKSGTVKPGTALSCGVPLVKQFDSEITTVFTTQFSRARQLQKSSEGDFSYVNLVGITEEELQVAEHSGADLLLDLLKHKKLDQSTKSTRSSVTIKSCFSVADSLPATASPLVETPTEAQPDSQHP